MAKQIIRTDRAPWPVGPYSQAVKVGDLLFVAGQGALDPQTGGVVGADVREQTRQVMENLRAILAAAGSSLADVVKSTCYLQDINDFAAFNEVYGSYFTASPPARTTIEAARLPRNLLIEIDVIAEAP